jgi:hypothetical protein
MPYFNAAYNAVKALLVSAGSRTYLLGSQAADGGVMNINSVAIASNVGTVAVTGWSGNLPIVGTPITIRGTQQGAGEFNVTNVPVTAASLDATGTGTVSFALTGTNLATTADIGTLSFVPQVTGETAVNNSFTIAGALARPSGARSQNAVFAQLSLPAAGVTALTLTAQDSEDNINWTPRTETLTIVAGAVTAGSVYFETTALFVRFATSGLAGSGPVALAVSI